jgi:hypothetical protein
MTTHKPTPLMQAARLQARAALAMAIEDVDAELDSDGCALEYPHLVLGYMVAAGAAYQALSQRDAISDAVEAFLVGQEERAKREKYALAVQ